MKSILRCSTFVATGKINLLDHGVARESVTRRSSPVENCPRQDAVARILSKIFFKNMRVAGRMLSRICFKSMRVAGHMLSRMFFKSMWASGRLLFRIIFKSMRAQDRMLSMLCVHSQDGIWVSLYSFVGEAASF